MKEMAEARTTRKDNERKTVTKALDHMEIHHAANGGHIMVHHFGPDSHGLGGASYSMNGESKPAEIHSFGEGEGDKAMAHVAEHMEMGGGEGEGESGAEEGE